SFESVAPPGRGGSSTVYQATIEGRDQEVALKILRPELLEQPTQVERFRREALHVANLRHPNTVRLLDYGQLSNGLVFAAIELLKGEPLSSRLARVGRLPFTQALHIIVQVLYSLSEAHQQNIIHRDLKPANIFLCEEPVRASVRVLDFGMALALDTLQVRLTTQGDIPGTPQYMAPEQASDQPLAKATDIYAVGLIFYEMLTGQHPFRGMRDMDVLFRKRNRSMHYNLDALPQGDAQLIEEVLAKSLEPDMYTRYPDAEAMLKALEARIAIPPPVSIDEFYSVTAVQARHRKAVLARLLERAEEALGTEDWIEARDSYQSALGVINTLATVDHSDGEEIEGKRGKALLNLSKALVALDALGVAEDALREAVQVLPYSSIEGLEARIMLADIITEQGLHERGAAFYDAALAHLTEQTPTSLHDRVYLGLATVAFHNADHHDSIAFIEELRDPNPRLKFQATVLKLRALCGLGRGPDAWAFVAQVEEEQDESMRIELLLAVSELAESQGLLDRAAQYLEKVFGLQKGLRNDYAGRYTTAQRLAELEAKRGRIESAYIYAGQSVAIARTMNDRWREIAARLAFGELLASEHDYLRAVEEIRVARRIQKDMNDREGLARSHYLLGDVCCQAGDMKAARKYFKEAMRYENEQATEFMVMAATRVAEVTEGMGKLDRAAEYYTYAIQVAGDIGIVQVGHRPRLGMARLQ
ncbi:MAG: serine/threonine-protein kinase, partial [Myxococcota bacterium]